MVLVAKSKQRRRQKARAITLGVILAVIMAGFVALFISLGQYVASLDTIYPNVWAEGIDMSGLTKEQVRQALIDSGYEQRASGISIEIVFPYGSSFTVTGDEVGMTLNAEEAAQAVYNFGRGGSHFGNEIVYIKSLFDKTELYDLSLPNYDAAIIRVLADEYTQDFNESLIDYDYTIEDDRIVVVRGTNYLEAVADEVFNFAEMTMRRAIEQNTHLEARFIPEPRTDIPIDLPSIYNMVYIEPIESRYDPETGDPRLETYDPVNMGATESRVGKSFDLAAAEQKLSVAGHGERIIIPIISQEPEMSQAQLRNKLFGDVLGERQASQGSDSYRSTNIRLASQAIDGLVMQPGELFSFNSIVGQRTAARGYQMANAYINGELVPEIGGGICQVSSTIYAALLQTDLEIVDRQPHVRTVGYLGSDGKGQDATVSWGTLDFKFRNSSDYPIRLEVVTEGAITVNVKIYGTRVSDVYYKVVSIEHEDSPIPLVTIEREVKPEDGIELELGESATLTAGNQGEIWEVWKYHYSSPDFDDPNNMILDEKGEQVRTYVGKTTYRMRQRVIVYNPD